MTTQSEMEPSIKIEEMKSVAHNRRGRQSTGARKACCRELPPKRERPIYPTSNDLPNLPQGGGGTYIHTDTYIPRLLTTEKQAQSGSPKMRNPTVETPTNRGERVKRCPNEIRAYMYDPSVLPSFLHSFLASFSTSSTAPVGRTPTVRHQGAHLA